MLNTKPRRLARHLGIAASLLLASQPHASGTSMIVAKSDDQSDFLERAASPTLDTDAVLRDLAAGRYYVSEGRPNAKRGPWRKIGRTAGRIAKYGPLAGVVGYRKNMKTSTKVLIGLGSVVAGVVVVYVVALNKAENVAIEAIEGVQQIQ